MVLLQNIAYPHLNHQTQDLIASYDWEQTDITVPLSSPYAVASDYHFFLCNYFKTILVKVNDDDIETGTLQWYLLIRLQNSSNMVSRSCSYNMRSPLILVDIVLKNGFRYKLSYKTSIVTCTLYYSIAKK